MTAAKSNFDIHIDNCNEAISIYNFLLKSAYKADFGLRYVWVASVSALDNYITELIVEKATQYFSNNIPFTDKILSERVPILSLMQLLKTSPSQAVFEFRAMITELVRYKTFQKADDVADGLSYIWSQKYKWNIIAKSIGITEKQARVKLNSIGARRDLIVHNADYNIATGMLNNCIKSDAIETIKYISDIVNTIDAVVP